MTCVISCIIYYSSSCYSSICYIIYYNKHVYNIFRYIYTFLSHVHTYVISYVASCTVLYTYHVHHAARNIWSCSCWCLFRAKVLNVGVLSWVDAVNRFHAGAWQTAVHRSAKNGVQLTAKYGRNLLGCIVFFFWPICQDTSRHLLWYSC